MCFLSLFDRIRPNDWGQLQEAGSHRWVSQPFKPNVVKWTIKFSKKMIHGLTQSDAHLLMKSESNESPMCRSHTDIFRGGILFCFSRCSRRFDANANDLIAWICNLMALIKFRPWCNSLKLSIDCGSHQYTHLPDDEKAKEKETTKGIVGEEEAAFDDHS